MAKNPENKNPVGSDTEELSPKGELFPESLEIGFKRKKNRKVKPAPHETIHVSEAINTGLDLFSELTPKPGSKYTFNKSIGYGGMKTVLMVKDRDTARDVAMAIMADPDDRPSSDKLRFLQEARITAKLEHPNIVPVHDIGLDSSGAPYFTMKMLKGETLASILKKLNEGNEEYIETYDLYSLLRFFIRVCNAVAFAHYKKVIHLDLKPENVQIGDYGEVLVLDWGLAKVIGDKTYDDESKSQGCKEKKHGRKKASDLTLDGVTKGTPGYMAPEQAAGRNSMKDERTDIYSLGAILYAILTWSNPLEGEDVEKILSDTVKGNIIPPRRKKPKMLIPGALEAVVFKAMAVSPAGRYQNVMEMRNDIIAYMNGFATVAEKAGFFRKIFLMINRHRVVATFTAIVTVLLIFLAIFTLRDYSKSTAGWIKIYEADFMGASRLEIHKGITFMDKYLKNKTLPWKLEPEGLRMPKYSWMWLTAAGVKDNIKVVIEVDSKGTSGTFEICVNSNIEPVKRWWHLPSGYSFQCGGDGGTRDIIFKNEDSGIPQIISSVETGFLPGMAHRIVLRRREGKLSISIDGRESLTVRDLFPPTGAGLDMTGLRTHSSSIWLKSVKIFRLALPERASPLVAGDTLLELRHFNEAIDKYMLIAENYGKNKVAGRALAKAYAAAASKLPEGKARKFKLLEIRNMINENFPEFSYRERILEIDTLLSWRNKNYKEAFRLIYEIFKINPYSRITSRIMQGRHEPLSTETGRELLYWISKTKNLKRLNISNLGLNSLRPLKDLRLSFLNCSGNNIKSLAPLKNMYLETLSCADNRIESLAPIQNMPVKDLNCSNNRISTIKELAGMPLRHFECSGNRIYSLDPLEGTPLEKLICGNNMIIDIHPLKNLELKYLDCSDNQIQELSSLSGMPLEGLDCSGNDISSLEPLRGIELASLNCSRNNISSLAPLENMPLTTLFCADNDINDISSLKGMPLSVLDISRNPVSSIKPLSGMPLKTLFLSGCSVTDVTALSECPEIENLHLPDHFKKQKNSH